MEELLRGIEPAIASAETVSENDIHLQARENVDVSENRKTDSDNNASLRSDVAKVEASNEDDDKKLLDDGKLSIETKPGNKNRLLLVSTTVSVLFILALLHYLYKELSFFQAVSSSQKIFP